MSLLLGTASGPAERLVFIRVAQRTHIASCPCDLSRPRQDSPYWRTGGLRNRVTNGRKMPVSVHQQMAHCLRHYVVSSGCRTDGGRPQIVPNLKDADGRGLYSGNRINGCVLNPADSSAITSPLTARVEASRLEEPSIATKLRTHAVSSCGLGETIVLERSLHILRGALSSFAANSIAAERVTSITVGRQHGTLPSDCPGQPLPGTDGIFVVVVSDAGLCRARAAPARGGSQCEAWPVIASPSLW